MGLGLGFQGFDHLVVGTGFRIGIESLDLLRDLRGEVLRWRHRMKVEAPSSLDGALLQLPYLGDGFQLMAIDPERSPALRHIYLFQESAILSHGLSGVGITGLKFGVPRLVGALTRSLFVGNWDLHFAELQAHCRQGLPEPEQMLDEPVQRQLFASLVSAAAS